MQRFLLLLCSFCCGPCGATYSETPLQPVTVSKGESLCGKYIVRTADHQVKVFINTQEGLPPSAVTLSPETTFVEESRSEPSMVWDGQRRLELPSAYARLACLADLPKWAKKKK